MLLIIIFIITICSNITTFMILRSAGYFLSISYRCVLLSLFDILDKTLLYYSLTIRMFSHIYNRLIGSKILPCHSETLFILMLLFFHFSYSHLIRGLFRENSHQIRRSGKVLSPSRKPRDQ